MRELARLAAALVAVLVLARDVAVAGAGTGVLTFTAIVAVVVVAGLTLWRDGVATASAVLLGAHYVAALAYGDVAVDLLAPMMAALVVAYADLLELATALPPGRNVDRALLRSSLRHLTGVVAVGTTAAVAAFAVAAVPWPGSEALRALGALGIVAVVVTPVLWLRRAG